MGVKQTGKKVVEDEGDDVTPIWPTRPSATAQLCNNCNNPEIIYNYRKCLFQSQKKIFFIIGNQHTDKKDDLTNLKL